MLFAKTKRRNAVCENEIAAMLFLNEIAARLFVKTKQHCGDFVLSQTALRRFRFRKEHDGDFGVRKEHRDDFVFAKSYRGDFVFATPLVRPRSRKTRSVTVAATVLRRIVAFARQVWCPDAKWRR